MLLVNPHASAKVSNVNIDSNYCDAYAKARKKYDADQFAAWYAKNELKCAMNREGGASQIEPTEKHNLRYMGYLADADSKGFSTVANTKHPVYTGLEMSKLLSCVQKLDKVT